MLEFALATLLIEDGAVPDRVLGSSMGVFAAAAIAGCVDRDEALRIVVTQALIVEKECEKGGMISVLGDPTVAAGELRSGQCELAAVNLPNHVTLAAPETGLTSLERRLTERQISFQRLAVRYAFHSRWVDAAGKPFQAFLNTVDLHPARIPIVCCAGARTVHEVPRSYFWSVAREPIRLHDTIQGLEQEGPFRYVDVGPAGSLATLVKYALRPGSRSAIHTALTPYSNDWQMFQSLQSSICTRRVRSAFA
jgi:acyl transferase domain-containing protein